MNVEMEEYNPPTDAASIEQLEREFDISLPSSYKVFLLDTNGGSPKNRLFPVQDRPFSPIEGVHNFLALGSPDFPTLELAYPLSLYAGAIPEDIVPIANEDTGNYICLDLRNGLQKVVFWDHRHFWGTGEWREQDVYFVAHSFDEFLTLLQPSPN